MSLLYNIDLFKTSMDSVFGRFLELVDEDGISLVYKVINNGRLNSGVENLDIVFNKEDLESMLLKLGDSFDQEQLLYCTHNEYEVLIEELGNRGYPRDILSNGDKYNVSNENVTITIQEPSEIFHLFLLIKSYITYSEGNVRYHMSPMTKRLIDMELMNHMNAKEDQTADEDKRIDGFKIIRDRRILSMKIVSREPMEKCKYEDYKYSYLFSLALNCKLNFVRIVNYQYSNIRFVAMTRPNSNVDSNFNMDIPRRRYNKELINYYQMALSTDNLLVKYLSLYHILEYFFENIYYDDLIQVVKNEISDPRFSLNDNNSVKGFIKSFEHKAGVKKGETIVFNEFSALKLTLEKFIDLGDLEIKINEYDPSLVTYYKNNKCDFSNSTKINFTDTNTIASRIYKNRNALVHSKDTDKEKYRPFKDEERLEKEIPLIKIIAEAIIINSSEIM